MSNFTDTPGRIRYFLVGRVPVKLAYGPGEAQFDGRGWVTVDAHNLLCPERRHSLNYVELCDDHDELTEAEYLEAVAKMDATDLSFERGQLASIYEMVAKEKDKHDAESICPQWAGDCCGVLDAGVGGSDETV